MRQPYRLLSLVALLGILHCSAPKPEPQIASSASEPSYAATYPIRLRELSQRFAEHEQAAKKIEQDFNGYPGELSDPPWKVVLDVLQRADAAGRSRSYVDGLRNHEAAHTFLAEDGDEVFKKAAGAAQYIVKKKPCEVEVSGTVVVTLRDGSEKALEKRLRSHNEGHAVLERYREALGKKNAAALEKQADDMAKSSYLAYVAIVEDKVMLVAMIDEADQIRKTTDEALMAEAAYQNEGGHTEPELAASRERVEALRKSKASIDSSLNAVRSLPEDLKKRIDEAQQRHVKARDALFTTLRSKANLKS